MVIKDLKMNLQIEELKAFLQTVQKRIMQLFLNVCFQTYIFQLIMLDEV